jgi:hypothetical protein
MKHLLFINKNCDKLFESFEKYYPYTFSYTTYLPIFKYIKNNLKYNHVLKSRFILNNIVEKYNSHNFKVMIYDTKYNKLKYKKVFLKTIEILSDYLYNKLDLSNIKIREFFIPNFELESIHDNIHSIESSYVIEVFVTFLLSECVSNNEIQHFPLYYGSFSHLEKDKKNKYTSYHNLIMEKMLKDFTYMAYDKSELDELSKTEKKYYENSDKDEEFIYKTDKYLLGYIFQILYSINFMWKKYNITHNDLHVNNIMYKETNLDKIEYIINKKKYIIPTNKKLIKIIDFGRACAYYKNIELNNSIFNKNGDCYNQYYFSDNKDIHLKSIKPRPINDVVMFLNDIYTRFDISNQQDIIYLCEKYLIDKDNNSYNFDNNSFDKYIYISKINWKTQSLDKILQDKIFNSFVKKNNKKKKKKNNREIQKN